ncbi:MAG: cupin domain-containing protein [Candidatus Nanohalobium sp.]
MKFQPSNSYFVDDNTEITDLFDAPQDSNFDAVLSEVDGYHPEGEKGKRIFNERSQKGYYILEGEGKLFVGEETHNVEEGDYVYVPEKTLHALEGSLKALIITSPPFNPEDEELRNWNEP